MRSAALVEDAGPQQTDVLVRAHVENAVGLKSYFPIPDAPVPRARVDVEFVVVW